MRTSYQIGRSDYSNGTSMSDNRFKAGTPAYAEWERAWMDAVRADPLLDEDEKINLLGEDSSRSLATLNISLRLARSLVSANAGIRETAQMELHILLRKAEKR